MTKTTLYSLVTCASLVAMSAASAQPTKIQFWHPGLGPLDEAVNAQVTAFNASQTQYEVVRTARGTYDETLNAAIASYRAKKHPHLVVSVAASTQTMLSSGVVVPVQDMLQQAGYQIDWNDYLQPILNYYRARDGKLLSWPFSVSTVQLWYNKDAFAKAGIAQPPATWDDMGEAVAKLRAAGLECGLTTGYTAWSHVDNYSFMLDMPIATRHNGLDGVDTELTFNNPKVIKHLERLTEWSKDGRYLYAGRAGGPPIQAFMSGRCGMLLQSSAVYAYLKKGAKFEFGGASVPSEKGTTPKNNVVGGGTVWVLKGHKDEEYKGVSAFLNFLARPGQQIKWHQDTGYIPLTHTAYRAMQASGYYAENPHQEVAIQQLTRTAPTPNTMTQRIGAAAQYGSALDDEFEAMFSGKKSPKEAMDSAVRRGNEFLRRYAQQQRAAANQ
jgi:sn-glycerol 3-phosphate transport system substrate-binding protein